MARLSWWRRLTRRAGVILQRAGAGPWVELRQSQRDPMLYREFRRLEPVRFASVDRAEALYDALSAMPSNHGLSVVVGVGESTLGPGVRPGDFLRQASKLPTAQRREVRFVLPNTYVLRLRQHEGSRPGARLEILRPEVAQDVIDAILEAVEDETVPSSHADRQLRMPTLSDVDEQTATQRQHEKLLSTRAARIGGAWGFGGGLISGLIPTIYDWLR